MGLDGYIHAREAQEAGQEAHVLGHSLCVVIGQAPEDSSLGLVMVTLMSGPRAPTVVMPS